MATCEKCGRAFAPSERLTEVTSLRVLCPECEAERRAAKAQRTLGMQGSHSAGGPMAVPPRSAGPVGPATPHRGGPGGPATPLRGGPGAAPPRSHVAPVAPVTKGPVNHANSASAAHARPAASAERPARPVAGRSSPTSAPRPRMAAPAPEVDEERETKEQRAERSARKELKQKGRREIWIAFSVAMVVMVVAGVVLWRVLGIKKAESAVEQARIDRLEGFQRESAAIDITTEDGANQLIAYIDANEAIWRDADFAPDVTSRRAKAMATIEGIQQRRDLAQRFETVEQALARAAELSADDLAEQRRRLEEIAQRASIGGADFAAKVAAAREALERTYVERLRADAEQAAGAAELGRPQLAQVQRAEDEILKLFEAAYRAWQKDTQDPALVAEKTALEDQYKAIIKLSDQAVERFFTPAVIQNTPWTDLLAPEHAKSWAGPALKGFEHRVDNGVLHMIGPAPEVDGEGIISIGDKEQWRDYVLDLEFTLVKGEVTVFFRLPPAYQENVESITLSTTGDGAFEAGASHSMVFRVIGSQLGEEIGGEDALEPRITPLQWTKVRKGAIGISIGSDCEARFTRARIKILR